MLKRFLQHRVWFWNWEIVASSHNRNIPSENYWVFRFKPTGELHRFNKYR